MRGFLPLLTLTVALHAGPVVGDETVFATESSTSGNHPASIGEGPNLPVQFEATVLTPDSTAGTIDETAAEEPTRLPSRGAETEQRLGGPRQSSPSGALGTVISSLAIVIGLFLFVVWVSRRSAPRHARLLPSEVIEVLGRSPLAGKQQMQLLRVGRKLVLVSASATGVQTLSEITDPEEVERLAGLCQQHSPSGVSGTFRQVFANLSDEPARKTRLGREARALVRSRERVFDGEDSTWEGGDA